MAVVSIAVVSIAGRTTRRVPRHSLRHQETVKAPPVYFM